MFFQMITPSDREVFLDELENNETAVAEKVLGSEEFARASYVAVEAVSKTKSEEKIRLIARLLRSGTERGVINDFDKFKMYVDIADSLFPCRFDGSFYP